MRLTGIAVAALLSATGLLAPALALGQQGDSYGRGYSGHMMDWGGAWYAMIFGPLFMIIMLAIVVAVAVLLVRWLGGGGHGGQAPHAGAPGRAPLDILKERYARGEIDREEFEERRRVLGE
jgi:putative membrane protein